MRIVALVKSPDHVCCRYRIAAFRPFLENAGFGLELRPWPSAMLSRLMLHRFLGGVDVLIVQRKILPQWQLAPLRRIATRLVYDFDDAMFLRDSFAPQGIFCARRAQRFRDMVQAADKIVAGNRFLSEQSCLWTDPHKVSIIPTCVNLARYRLARHDDSQRPVKMVWIGSASTFQGLERLIPFLEEVSSRQLDFRFKIICDRFIESRRLSIERCLWTDATEAEELAKAQIGFSWLPDDLWSRGKCGLKVLQYMAAGLPVIANPVGIHRELIVHGVNGFLVDSAAECAQALRTLADSSDLRRRMGGAGRQRALDDFHITMGGCRWVSLLQSLTDGTQQPVPICQIEEEGRGV